MNQSKFVKMRETYRHLMTALENLVRVANNWIVTVHWSVPFEIAVADFSDDEESSVRLESLATSDGSKVGHFDFVFFLFFFIIVLLLSFNQAKVATIRIIFANSLLPDSMIKSKLKRKIFKRQLIC